MKIKYMKEKHNGILMDKFQEFINILWVILFLKKYSFRIYTFIIY